jgi:hypothetical protein
LFILGTINDDDIRSIPFAVGPFTCQVSYFEKYFFICLFLGMLTAAKNTRDNACVAFFGRLLLRFLIFVLSALFVLVFGI